MFFFFFYQLAHVCLIEFFFPTSHFLIYKNGQAETRELLGLGWYYQAKAYMVLLVGLGPTTSN
jgi:hypothetical protein